MKRSERIKSLGGPGGLRCRCCGGGDKPSGKANRHAITKRARRVSRNAAIREGLSDAAQG